MTNAFMDLFSFLNNSVNYTKPISGDVVNKTLISVMDLKSASIKSGVDVVSVIGKINTSASLIEDDFLSDFYSGIWIIPTSMTLKNPILNNNYPFYIWNAYPYFNTLQNINNLPQGIDLDIEEGDILNGIEMRLVNLTLDSTSPISHDDYIGFDFSKSEGALRLIIERLNIIDDIPINEVQEKLSWLTDIQISFDGTEQRIALRGVPRKELSLKITLFDGDKINKLNTQFYENSGRQIVIPQYHYSSPLTQDMSIGDVIVRFNNYFSDIRPSELVYIYDNKGNSEVKKVTGVTTTYVTLDSPISFSGLKNKVYVCSALPCLVGNDNKLSRGIFNNYGICELNILSQQERSSYSSPYLTGGLTINTLFNSYLLDKQSIYSESSQSFENGFERFDYGVGVVENVKRWNQSKISFERKYLINRFNGSDMEWWKEFLDYLKGQQKTFLVPSERSDLRLVDNPSLTTINVMTVSGNDYGIVYFKSNVFKRLRVQYGNYIQYANVLSVSIDSNNNTVVTLDTNIDFVESSKDEWVISFVYNVRLNSDNITINHTPQRSYITLPMITVEE